MLWYWLLKCFGIWKIWIHYNWADMFDKKPYKNMCSTFVIWFFDICGILLVWKSFDSAGSDLWCRSSENSKLPFRRELPGSAMQTPAATRLSGRFGQWNPTTWVGLSRGPGRWYHLFRMKKNLQCKNSVVYDIIQKIQRMDWVFLFTKWRLAWWVV